MTSVRIILILGIFVLSAAALSGRLFALQVYDHGFFAAFARGQQQVFTHIAPERGKILAQSNTGEDIVLATMRDWPKLYAVPKDIEDPEGVARELAPILTMSEEDLFNRISKKDDPYEPISARLTDEQAEQIRALSQKGLILSHERSRMYPQGKMAAHLLGFLAFADGETQQGAYGIEAAYDEILEGTEGALIGERDAQGRIIAAFSKIVRPSSPGADVVLTIDPVIQQQTEKILDQYGERFSATGGSVIVMEPSGTIRALANYPSFDPNNFASEENASVYQNTAVGDLFEPGSVFKPLTMASAIEGGAVTPDTTYENTGNITIGAYTISNTLQEYNGVRSMTEVLMHSLNTGSVFAMQQLGKEKYLSYIKDLMLDQKTEIGLPGDIGGDIKNLSFGRDINFATVAFGQGVAVTPLAFTRAFAALANGGVLPSLSIIKEVRFPDGHKEEPELKAPEQVFSSRTARLISAMLTRVVHEGTGKTAKIPGWNISGKTGTAQIPRKDGPGYSDETIHSFIGYFPAFAPRYVILVKLDRARARYAESTAAPAFRELAQFLISYSAIPPDQ